MTRIKILGISTEYEDKTINIFFKKTYHTIFQLLSLKQMKMDVFAVSEKPV